MRSPVALYLRVHSATGSWIYVPSVYSPNHKLKPLYGIVDGVPKRCPEGATTSATARMGSDFSPLSGMRPTAPLMPS